MPATEEQRAEMDRHRASGDWEAYHAAYLATLTPEERARIEAQRAKHQREREIREKRKVPFPVWPDDRKGKGWCVWCGCKIFHVEGKKKGQPNDRSTWHKHCLHEFYLHSRLEDQYRFLVQRDGKQCWDCKTSPSRWQRGSITVALQWGRMALIDDEAKAWFETLWPADVMPKWNDPARNDPEWKHYGEYCAIDRVPALEVDHEVPLWSIQHLPDDERRPYYGPENLRLRCVSHHKAKIKREAAQRAAERRALRAQLTLL